MQWVYGSGFPTDERKTWRTIIHDNLAAKFLDLANTYDENGYYSNLTTDFVDDLWVSLDPWTTGCIDLSNASTG
jgi:hypothetical protein